MPITIDGAGRVVIPKTVRDQFQLVAGNELEIETSGNEIRLKVMHLESSLAEKRGVLVHHGAKKSDLDIVEFLRGERDSAPGRLLGS